MIRVAPISRYAKNLIAEAVMIRRLPGGPQSRREKLASRM